MARYARKKSASGFYHVIVRGVGKQILFEDRDDYARFLGTVERYLGEQGVQAHAYCLMENHAHLLLRDPEGRLDIFMKKVEGSYAFYFNHKYERIGTLFQERYKSEPVDSEAYFAVVLRYILQNPLKARKGTIEDYPWSSYAEMAGEPWIIRTDFIIGLFGRMENALKYVVQPNHDSGMEPSKTPVNDVRAKAIIRSCLHVEDGTRLQAFDRRERDKALHALKEKGLSVRQIERLTGISRGIVMKA